MEPRLSVYLSNGGLTSIFRNANNGTGVWYGVHLLPTVARFPYAQLLTVALYHLIVDKECYLCADIAYCVEKKSG